MIQGKSTISLYGKTILISLLIPKQGGNVTGSISGACSGDVTGIYSGGDFGSLQAKSHVSCPVFFTTITGEATFTGEANVPSQTLQGTYTATAQGKTSNGPITFTLFQ